MSRIAVFASLAGESSEARERLVRGMLATMPGSAQRTVVNGPAVCGWTGRAGGGVYEGAGVCVAIDGDVFNFDELAESFDPQPRSDTELVALLYARHSFSETLSRLNGDYAIVLFDPATGRLWLGRDRVGIKPLYYMTGEGWAACASQPSGLLAKPGVRPDVNRRYAALVAASHYRTFDNAPEESPFVNMRQIPAAHIVEIDLSRGTVHCAPYWQLREESPTSADEARLAEEYRDLLKQSVGRRLRRAGKVAFTLSGGMDSSSVLCCAAEVSGRRQVAYSSVYVDPTYDERIEIQDVVRDRVGQWHKVEIGNEVDVLDQVARLVAIHNEPVATATWLSHERVCQAAADEGFESLFGGLGGDELNAGEYEYFPLFFADLRAAGKTALMDAEIAKWAEHHDHPIYRKDAQTASEMMGRLTVPGMGGICRPNLNRQHAYLGALLPSYYDLHGFVPVMEHPFSSYLKNRAFQDLTRETTPCCMRAEDRQTAHYGLRHYDPFLDYELIEFMFRIPGEMKIRGGVTKHLLRKAMDGILPEQTRSRIKKTGWNAPAHRWFMGKGLEAIRDLVASRRFRERGMYDIRFVERIVDEHDEIVSSGDTLRENHMMFLWQLINVNAWMDWLEAGFSVPR
jgi:asparagine synthase (glutamine-hydrolysing)